MGNPLGMKGGGGEGAFLKKGPFSLPHPSLIPRLLTGGGGGAEGFLLEKGVGEVTERGVVSLLGEKRGGSFLSAACGVGRPGGSTGSSASVTQVMPVFMYARTLVEAISVRLGGAGVRDF